MITVYPEDGIPLLFEPFHDPTLPGWHVSDEGTWQGPSNWSVEGGAVQQTANIWSPPADPGLLPQHGTYLLYRDGLDWQDYHLTVTMSSTDDDALGVMFRFHDRDNYYRFSWDRERGYRRLVKRVHGEFRLLAEDRIPYEVGKEYEVQIITSGTFVEIRVNDEVLFEGPVRDKSLSRGSIALYSWYNNGGRFRNLFVKGMEVESDSSEDADSGKELTHEDE